MRNTNPSCHQVKIHRLGWQATGDAEQKVIWLQPDGTEYEPPPVLRRARAPDPS